MVVVELSKIINLWSKKKNYSELRLLVRISGDWGVWGGVFACPHRLAAISKSKTFHQHRCTTQIHQCMPHLSASSMCELACVSGSGSCTCADGRSWIRFAGEAKPATRRVSGMQHGGGLTDCNTG